ncbi:MAG TPA: hypothetical protein VGK16_12915 [Candidatus Limnocylindrales bacterium]
MRRRGAAHDEQGVLVSEVTAVSLGRFARIVDFELRTDQDAGTSA